MITGRDKKRFKELEEKNSNLEYKLQRGLHNIEINKSLENIVKAILNKFDGQVTITKKEIEEARYLKIYTFEDIMQDAQQIKLVSAKNRIKGSIE